MRFLPYALVALFCFVLGVAVGVPYGAYLQEGSDWKASDYANFWNIGGTWLGAVATTFVGALALWFQHKAEEENKPRLHFRFSAAFIPGYSDPFFCFSIKSNGKIRIIVHSVSFKLHDGSSLIPTTADVSSKLGSILNDSAETLNFFFGKNSLPRELALNGMTFSPSTILISSNLGVNEYLLSKSIQETLTDLINREIQAGYSPQNYPPIR